MASARGAPRPPVLNAAFWLGIAAVAVGFLIAGLSIAFVGEADLAFIHRSVEANGQSLTMEQVRTAFRATVIGIIVFLVIVAALWVLFLSYMRQGRSWARIVVTIVGVLWILFTSPSMMSGVPWGPALAALQVLLIIATIVCAFLPASGDFFRAMRGSGGRSLGHA